VVIFRIADTRMDRAKRPEIALFASWATSQVIMASSVALSGPHVPTMDRNRVCPPGPVAALAA
jgi:hypothetical protein